MSHNTTETTIAEHFAQFLAGLELATIPAAVSERFQCTGERTLSGIVAGLEAVCRLNHVAAGHMHRAGFHPVGVIGALGAAAGVTMGLDRNQLTASFGMAASMSSSILEYLTDGAWTKRLHPGWAAQSGLMWCAFIKCLIELYSVDESKGADID